MLSEKSNHKIDIQFAAFATMLLADVANFGLFCFD